MHLAFCVQVGYFFCWGGRMSTARLRYSTTEAFNRNRMDLSSFLLGFTVPSQQKTYFFTVWAAAWGTKYYRDSPRCRSSITRWCCGTTRYTIPSCGTLQHHYIALITRRMRVVHRGYHEILISSRSLGGWTMISTKMMPRRRGIPVLLLMIHSEIRVRDFFLV